MKNNRMQTREQLLAELGIVKKENQCLKDKLVENQFALQERRKELTCYEKVTSLMFDSMLSGDDVLHRTVNLIPDSWQFPEHTFALIELNESKYQTESFQSSEYKIQRNILVKEAVVGSITVFYTGKLKEKTPPFLAEEGVLLSSLSVLLGLYLTKEYKKLQIKKADKKFQDLIKNLDDVVYELSPDQRISFVSPSVEYKLGYEPSELLGKAISEIIAPEDMEFVLSTIENSTTSRSRTLEYRILTKGNKRRWVRTTSTPIFVEDKFVGRTGILYDIHEEKTAQFKLEESEQKYRTIVESINEVIYEVDTSGKILFVSQLVQQVLGYRNEEVLGRNIFEFVHPDDLTMAQRALSTLEHREYKHLEYRYLDKQGNIRWIRSATAPRYKNGKVIGGIGAMSDITEKKAAAEQLLRLTLAVEQSPVSIVITNLEGNIEYANLKACETTGYELDELIGQNPRVLKSGETAPKEYDQLWNQILHGETWRGIFHNKKKSGEYYWESAQITPIKNTDGNMLGYFAVKEDITERIEIQNALIKSERRFQQIAEQNQSVIWEVDANGLYTYVSPAVKNVWNYNPEDIVGKKHFYDLHPVKGRSAFKTAAFSVFLQKGIFKSMENQIVDGNKTVRWMMTNGAPVLDHEGKLIGYRGSDMDITERKKNELQIKEQNAKLSAVINAIPDLIFVINDKGIYVEYYASDLSELLLLPKDIIGSSMYDVFDEDLAQYFLNQINQSIAVKSVVNVNYAIQKEKNKLFFEARISPIDEHSVLVLSRNISEAKEQELQLKKLSLAVTQSPVITVITDTYAKIEYVNPAFEQITGYKHNDVIGKNVRILQSGRTDRSTYSDLWNTIQDGKVWQGEWINKKKNGELYWEGVLISPIFDENWKIINFLAVKQDITKRKETEKELADLTANLEKKVEERTNLLEATNQNLRNEVEVRRRTEEALAQSEEKYRSVVENVKEVIFITDNDGNWTFLNNAWTEITGFTLDESIGKLFVNYVHPDDRERNWKLFEPLIQEKKEFCRHEIRYLTKNGSFKWIEVYARLGKNEIGETIGTYGTLRDVTERKLAEDELKWNKSLLEMMATSSPLGFLVVDNRTDNILYHNRRFCEIWGLENLDERMKTGEFKNNDIIPYCVLSLVDIEAFAESCKPLQDEQNRSVVSDEIPFTGNRTIRRYSTQIRSNSDKYFGRFYIFEDITERKRAEQFENELLILSSELTGLAYENVNAALNLALERIGKYLDTDRSYIFEFDDEQILMNNTHEWCGEGITAEIENLKNIPCEIFPNWMDTLKKHKVLVISSVKDLNQDWKSEKEILAPQGVKSLIVMPLVVEHKLIGFVGLDSVRNYREYSLSEINTLKVWSVMLTSLLQSERIEILLQQTREDYETFFNTTDDFLFILNMEGKIIHTNRTVEKRLGYRTEELLGKHLVEMHPPQMRTEAKNTLLNTIEKGTVVIQLPLFTKNKNQIPAETRIVTGTWNGEKAIFGISRDISERLQAEEDLRKSEARWQFALESSGDGIWDFDLIKREIYFSPTWIKLFGYENESSINNPAFLRQIIHPDDVNQLLNRLEAHQNNNTRIFESDFRVRDNRGKYKWIIAKGKVINYSSQGIPTRMIGTLTDISTRKNFEIALAESLNKEKELNEMKSRFVSMTSHEFRTPLATILMSAEIIESYRSKMSDADIANKIVRIKENVNFLRNVMEKVLDLSHIESGKMKFQPSPTNFGELLEKTVNELKSSGVQQSLSFECAGNKFIVNVDQQMMKQVFRNLISNSMKYSPKNSIIRVYFETSETEYKVHVEDNGIGIKEADRDRVFLPFNRGTNVGNIHGTGLGLSLSQSLIQCHGGNITFESIPNVRTIFTVTLPL